MCMVLCVCVRGVCSVCGCIIVGSLGVQAFCVYRGEVGEGGQGVVHRWDHEDGNIAVKFMVRTAQNSFQAQIQ